MLKKNSYRKKMILQKDASDCGVVCLQNILAEYKINISLEVLREKSGTNEQGTTLLGLYQAAVELGFLPVGAEATGMKELEQVKYPCILHLTMEDMRRHYVVYYPHVKSRLQDSEKQFVIGDPAIGVKIWTAEQLEKRWQSKTILLLEPDEKLMKQTSVRQSKIKWFHTVIIKDLELLCLVAVLGCIIAGLGLSTAVFTQRLIDLILPKHQLQKLITGVALLMLLLSAKTFLAYLRNYFLIKQSYKFNNRITANFFESLLYLPKPFFDNRKTGDFTSRLNDIARIQQAVSCIIGDIGVQVLYLIISVSVLFYYNYQVGLCCLMVIPLQFIVIKYYQRPINENYRASMSANAKKESSYIETIKGISTIKALGSEPFFIRKGKAIVEAFQNTLYNLGESRIRFAFASEIVTTFFLLIIIIWTSTLVLQNKLRPGELIAILQITASVAQTVTTLSMANLQLQEAKVAFDRMYEFASINPEFETSNNYVQDGKANKQLDVRFNSLEVADINFRFKGRKALLHRISFSVKCGDIVAITGESGQGKSTLFQLLQRMYMPESGEILINGYRMDQINMQQWRKILGIVPQEINIFSGTLWENIVLSEDKDHLDNVIKFCNFYGFDSYFSSFPQGYFTMLGEGGITLSGGQKQLLGLARCLYHKPQLLLLDEPTSAMDAATEQFVINLLQKIKMATGIILISHRDSLVDMADRFYKLENGMLYLQSFETVV